MPKFIDRFVVRPFIPLRLNILRRIEEWFQRKRNEAKIAGLLSQKIRYEQKIAAIKLEIKKLEDKLKHLKSQMD